MTCDYILPRFLNIMSALVQDSPDRAVTAIEPLTGSDNYATWNRLMTSYLKARQVWDVVSGDLQRPDCQFKYAKPITALRLWSPTLMGRCGREPSKLASK